MRAPTKARIGPVSLVDVAAAMAAPPTTTVAAPTAASSRFSVAAKATVRPRRVRAPVSAPKLDVRRRQLARLRPSLSPPARRSLRWVRAHPRRIQTPGDIPTHLFRLLRGLPHHTGSRTSGQRRRKVTRLGQVHHTCGPSAWENARGIHHFAQAPKARCRVACQASTARRPPRQPDPLGPHCAGEEDVRVTSDRPPGPAGTGQERAPGMRRGDTQPRAPGGLGRGRHHSQHWAGSSASSPSWTTASTPRPKSSPTTSWSPGNCWRCRSRGKLLVRQTPDGGWIFRETATISRTGSGTPCPSSS